MWTAQPRAKCPERRKKKEKTRENKRRRMWKKVLIHSCRCVTFLLPQQRFTTELMTKGWAPCSLLWPREQYGGCEWLIPLDRWQVSPLSNLGTHFSTGLGCCLTGMGKPGLLTEPSPWADSGSHCKGKYYLHCQVVAIFVTSEDELRENMPPEGELEWRWYQLRKCESYSV